MIKLINSIKGKHDLIHTQKLMYEDSIADESWNIAEKSKAKIDKIYK